MIGELRLQSSNEKHLSRDLSPICPESLHSFHALGAHVASWVSANVEALFPCGRSGVETVVW